MRNYLTIIFLFIFQFVFGQSNLLKVKESLEYMRNGYVTYALTTIYNEASLNNMYAQYILGVCSYYGIGFDKDLETGFQLFRRTAERGLTDAMFQLSKIYKEGIVVSQNTDKSQDWESRFIKRGGKMVVPNIIEIYNEGMEHIENYSVNPLNANDNFSNSQIAINSNNAQTITIIKEIQTIDTSKTSKPEDTEPQVANADKTAIKSYVDNVPEGNHKATNSFAIIIANENYQNVIDVENAINDGKVFSQYCKKTLGIPENHISFITNATYNNIRKEINWIKDIAKTHEGEASIIFYYAGHGMPDEKSLASFLIPSDGDPKDSETCIALQSIYNSLGQLPLKQAIVILDACFSGANRGDGMLIAARGVSIKPKQNSVKGNLVVLSATSGDETAYPIKNEGHGLFTFHLLKVLQETKGQITLGELYDQVSNNVRKQSIVDNRKSQTPTISHSSEIGENWRSLTLQ